MVGNQNICSFKNFFAMKQIHKLYIELRDTVVKPAVIRASYYALTIDLWTSCARHPFMSFAMHLIDDNWQLKTFCLDTAPVLDDQTGQNLPDAV